MGRQHGKNAGLHKTIKNLFSGLRWKAVHLLAPRRRVIARGLEFTLQCDNWITHYRWETFNHKEPETLDWIDQQVEGNTVFFDVGANIGLYSIYAAMRHPHLHIIAFEPEYSNLHLLKENIIANSLQEKISIYSIALGNAEEITTLKIPDLTPGGGWHFLENKRGSFSRDQTRKVLWEEGIAVLSLDQFCKQTGCSPHFMKVDVEGNSEGVLQGGGETLQSPSLRSVLIEVEPGQERVMDCLQRRGFRRQTNENNNYNQIWTR